MNTKEKYYCPMHCEGDKTYEKPGECPVCGMFLVPVSRKKNRGKMDFQNMKVAPIPVKGEAKEEGKYYCPMHCEGDKTYDAAGRCPVCNMFLVPVSGKKDAGKMDFKNMEIASITVKGEAEDEGKYYCPMHCEGEKTYDEAGRCPVCNMFLVPVSGKKSASKMDFQNMKVAPVSTKEEGKVEGKYYCPMHCEGGKTYEKPGECPVCGMILVPVSTEKSAGKIDFKNMKVAPVTAKGEGKGTGLYYCPMHCEGDKTYEKPGDCPVCGMHLNKEESASPSKIVYTCPMHPEIKQNGPGSCPKCGMDLVPEKGMETSDEEKAYQKMKNKFWIALALSIPVFIISMSDVFGFLHLNDLAPKKVWGWIEFALATPVVFYCSWDFFIRGWNSVRRWMPNMWTLISIGVPLDAQHVDTHFNRRGSRIPVQYFCFTRTVCFPCSVSGC